MIYGIHVILAKFKNSEGERKGYEKKDVNFLNFANIM